MEKYKCIKSFDLPFQDENGFMTERYGVVNKDSIYEYDYSYIGESEIRMYLKNGDDDFGYIDITKEMRKKYFVRIQ